MGRHWISATVVIVCLAWAAGLTHAKKKEGKPVQERFEATVSAQGRSIRISIREYSSDEEMQNFAQSFNTGGEGALRKALGKSKKGFFRLGDGPAMPLMIVQSQSAGSVRKLNMLGLAPTVFSGQFGGSVSIGHRGYDYTFIQLEVDEQGKGRGALVPYANIVFDPQGRIMIKPMGAVDKRPAQLVNVHREE
jgi:hypothetical protein